MWPKKITLRNTSDGSDKKGFMWRYTSPQAGRRFQVMESKLTRSFLTPEYIEEIKKEGDIIVLKTETAIYHLIIN